MVFPLPRRRFAFRTVATISAAGLLTGSALALTAAPAVPATARTSTFSVSGIDIASWQHPGGAAISWSRVKGAGHSFALIKATESTTYVNPYYAGDERGARAAGLVVGAYHYARPKLPLSSARAQAQSFVRAVGTQQLSRTLPPVLDLEETGGLSKSQVARWAKRWLSTVQSLTGRTPMLYSFDAFLRRSVHDVEDFRGYPLWYANYRSAPPDDLPGAWDRWHIWQHSSKGNVPGIKGRVDVNWFNGSLGKLRTFGTGRVPAAIRQSSVQRYETTHVTGRVDVAYAGALVVRREKTKRGWVTRAVRRVGADGRYSFTVTPKTMRAREYRVYLYSNSPYARVRSVTLGLRVARPWAKASISKTKVKPGRPVLIRGRVDRFYAGERVVRQNRTARGWRSQTSGRVRTDGRFDFVVRPTDRRVHRYRVYLSATGPTARAASRTVAVRVR